MSEEASEAANERGEDLDLTCPICLVTSSNIDASTNEGASGEIQDGTNEFVKTPCKHVFCKACIERVLLRPRQDGMPTRAPCPMCRESCSLFDLCRARRRDQHHRDRSSSLYARSSDAKSWPVASSQYKQRTVTSLRPSEAGVSVLDRFIQRFGAVEGYGITFAFEESVSSSMAFTNSLRMAFDCDWTEISASDAADDGLRSLDSVSFDVTYYHEKSRTFHGRASFANPVTHNTYFYDRVKVSLNFSEGCRYIRRGILEWKFAATHALTYPLDGSWEVQYTDRNTMTIFVQRHLFSCEGARYNIEIGLDYCPRFRWSGQHQWVVQHSNYKLMPGSTGPGVGETLEWSTPFDGHGHIVWKRLISGLSNAWQTVDLRAGHFVYQRCNQLPGDDQTLVPSYRKDTVWGNTFCQLFTVGMASYHFAEKPDMDGVFQAYISYESPRTEGWPRLDNGEAVPARVPFRNIQWDTETRTFKGDICWEEEYNTTWMRESKWSYEIVFDQAFMFVASGTCTRSSEDPHRFGHDLVYINAAVEVPLREIKESTRTTGAFLDVLRKWRDGGEATPGTLEMMGEVAMNVMADRESVFDFNL